MGEAKDHIRALAEERNAYKPSAIATKVAFAPDEPSDNTLMAKHRECGQRGSVTGGNLAERISQIPGLESRAVFLALIAGADEPISSANFARIVKQWRNGEGNVPVMAVSSSSTRSISPSAPAPKAPPALKAKVLRKAPGGFDEWMEYYDDVDASVGGNGKVPRIDLKNGINNFHELSALVATLDKAKMVLARDEFATIVRQYLNPPKKSRFPFARDAKSVQELLSLFDALDEEDGTGFINWADLLREVETLSMDHIVLRGLLDELKTNEGGAMMIDRDEFEGMAKRWAGLDAGSVATAVPEPQHEPIPEPAAAPPAAVSTVTRVTRKDLVLLFETVDAEKTGILPKRELKPALQAKQHETGDIEIGRLVEMIDAHHKSLIEKIDYRKMLVDWDKQNSTALAAAKVEKDMISRTGSRR